jgi:hypothetical protein
MALAIVSGLNSGLIEDDMENKNASRTGSRSLFASAIL